MDFVSYISTNEPHWFCCAHSKTIVAFSLSGEVRDHPFKTSAFFMGGGVKNWQNLPTDSSKKTADGRAVEVKNRENFVDVLNGWSLTTFESRYFWLCTYIIEFSYY